MQTLISILRRFKLLLFAYVFFILIWVIAKVYKCELIYMLESEKKLNLGSGFYTSWLASLGEDILFFGIIGFIGLILSTKLPQDETFNIRVDSLANGRKVGDKARKFLNKKIRELLVYNDTANVTLIIKTIDTTNNLAEIYAGFHNVCTNMCKDVVNPLNTNAYVIPTHHLDNDYGYISQLTIYEVNNPSNCNTIIDGDILKLDKNGFNISTLFQIPANSAAVWKFGYSIWQLLSGAKSDENNWYFVQVSGYCESFNIKIVNQTTYDVKYNIEYINRDTITNELKEIEGTLNKKSLDKEEINPVIQNIAAHHGDKFKIYFHI